MTDSSDIAKLRRSWLTTLMISQAMLVIALPLLFYVRWTPWSFVTKLVGSTGEIDAAIAPDLVLSAFFHLVITISLLSLILALYSAYAAGRRKQ